MAKTRNSDRGVSKWRLCTRTYVKHMVRGIRGRIGWEWRHFFSAMCPEHQFLHGLPTAQKSRPQFSWGCLKEKKRFYCEDMMRRWEEARTLSESFREWTFFDQISRTWPWPHFSFFQYFFDDTLCIWSLMMQMNFQNNFGNRLLSHLKSGDQYSKSKVSKGADPQKTQSYRIRCRSGGKPSTWFPPGDLCE